jgi:site-specific DNA-methyltransferase (adenine-specific)
VGHLGWVDSKPAETVKKGQKMSDLQGEGWRVFSGSCLDRLRELSDESVDAVVTDPPYELGFMGKGWDSSGIAYNIEVWRECLRVLKPGAHLLAFSGSRTYHRMTVAIEDAGFEVRDMIAWISNKTFPKSHNVEKATGSSDWAGWGTALKPSLEPVVMARKPLIGTVAENVLAYGTGGLNIDGTRIGTETITINTFDNGAKPWGNAKGDQYTSRESKGRWPSNVMLDEFTARLVDEQSGIVKGATSNSTAGQDNEIFGKFGGLEKKPSYNDLGGASRFFYVARASKRDRNEGLEMIQPRFAPTMNNGIGNKEHDPETATPKTNFHPTVKPTDLMRQLVRLVTPPGGVVLDPFTGSGSTGKAAILEGFDFIGVELTNEYLPIIEGRLSHAVTQRTQAEADALAARAETLF